MTRISAAYQCAELRLRIARARLLLDLASKADDDALAALLTFARMVDDGTTGADTVVAFRAAQADLLQAAQAELDRLTGPHVR